MKSDSRMRALKEHMRYCRVPRRKKKHRFAIAQRYGVPLAWVRLEDELVHPEENVKTSLGFLFSLRTPAKAAFRAVLILLLQAGRS